MKIAAISINSYTNNNRLQSAEPSKYTPPLLQVNASDSVSFGARITNRFPKKFLKELLNYGLPCPICNKLLIPLDLLNEPAKEALKIFTPFNAEMSTINKVIYAKLFEIAPNYPNKNLQELLQILQPKAEKLLIQEQTEVMHELQMISTQLSKSKSVEFRKILLDTSELIHKGQTKPIPKKFKRKNVIKEFDDFALSLKDDKIRVAVMNTIRKLPTSENSPNAFIVKYSTRSPEEIGMKLYKNPFATMEHVTPESEGGKIVIWECSEDNGARGNTPLNIIAKEKPDTKKNFQKHFDRLIEIYHSTKLSPYLQENKELLKEYIFTTHNEITIASKGTIKIDISKLGKIPEDMIIREIQRIRESGNTNYLRNLYKMLQDK